MFYQQLARFIAAGLLICWCAIALEYLYVIDPILKLVHPRPGKVSESYSFVVVKTLLDIALRDLALFSIVGFRLSAYVMQHASRLAEGVAGYVEA